MNVIEKTRKLLEATTPAPTEVPKLPSSGLHEAKQAWETAVQKRKEAETVRSAESKRDSRSEVEEETYRVSRFKADRALIEAEIAECEASRAYAQALSRKDVESGDPDACTSDWRRVASDVRSLLCESERLTREADALTSAPFQQDVQSIVAKSLALRAASQECLAMADRRIEQAKEADNRVRTRRGAAKEPAGTMFPARPGFTSGPHAWLAAIEERIATPDRSKMDGLEQKLRTARADENRYLASLQRRKEDEEENKRRFRQRKELEQVEYETRANATASENAKRLASYQAQQAAIDRLAAEYRARKGL